LVNIDIKHDNFLITGAKGFLGSHTVETFRENGAKNIFTFSIKELDLRDEEDVKKLFTFWYAANRSVNGTIGAVGVSELQEVLAGDVNAAGTVRCDRRVETRVAVVVGDRADALIEKLARFGTADALIVTDTLDLNLGLSARNLHLVDVCDVSGADPVTLVRHEKVIMTVPALKRFEEMLG